MIPYPKNDRSRRDLSTVFNDQDNEFINEKLEVLNIVTFNRNQTSDDEPSDIKHVDDSIGERSILKFNQTLQKYLKVSVGNTFYSITKYIEQNFTGTTIKKYPNQKKFLL